MQEQDPWRQVEPQQQVVGVVEMGGASIQVTFQTQQHVPVPFVVPLGTGEPESCTLFTHSIIGWGREAAMQQIITGLTSPCFNAGYVSPVGAFLFLSGS
jgi:hypothetical protein